ncbi:MAG: acetylxylan esterase [Cyclobacteriaceae bacterium]|nr:acetylxylan esterase [Cyclobacteriaceae bacterium]
MPGNKMIPKSLLFILIISVGSACLSKKEISVSAYYNYDHELPLKDSVILLSDSAGVALYSMEFNSTHNERVTGLLAIPGEKTGTFPVVILLHGLGDRKTVDYIEAGNSLLTQHGYAVLRIDVANHGDRKVLDYEFDLTDGYKYWTRDIIAQTVFDLRRAVDFLETRKEIDTERIGFFGISLGGMIGTVFCSVDNRVAVPVIALAGGNLSLMFGVDAITDEAREYFSIIDPINFVAQIKPRPLLMINAENDEVIPPITSKMLFKEASEPKNIIWYNSKHRDLPVEEAYMSAISWFDEKL